jgi:branched-chain amino acid transport system substrate-binding protein
MQTFKCFQESEFMRTLPLSNMFGRVLCFSASLCIVMSTAARAGEQTKQVRDLVAVAPESSDVGERIGVTNSEIIVGAGLPLTGKLAFKGVAIQHAVDAYFQDLNEHGGINGRKLKLIACDDAYDPDKAVECFNHSFKDKAFLTAFCTGSPTAAKYIRMSEINKMPTIGYLVGTPLVYEPRHVVFTVRPSYATEAERQMTELYATQKLKKIAIVYQNDAFGAGCRQGTLTALNKFHGAPVTEASYSRDHSNVGEALNQVMAQEPDAVVLGCSSGEIKRITELRKEKGWKCLFVTFSPQNDALVAQGKLGEGILITQVLPPLDEKLPSVALYHKLLKKYYPNDKQEICGLEAFVNAMVLAEGLKRAGHDLTREAFIKALESLRGFDVGIGYEYRVTFGPQAHVGWAPRAAYLGIIRDGKISAVTPNDMRELVKAARSK